MNSLVRDGPLTGRKRRRIDPPRTTERRIAAAPKYKRIVICLDTNYESENGEEPMAVDAAAAAFPGLDPAGERNAGSSTMKSAVQPTIHIHNNGRELPTEDCLDYDFEKNLSTIHNHNLLDHLQQTDGKKKIEVLKKIFTLCYQRTEGCLQKSKLMMEQLKTNCFVELNMIPEHGAKRLTEKVCSVYNNVKEENEKCHKKEILFKHIGDQFIKLFGMEHYESDNKILEETPIPSRDLKKLNKSRKITRNSKNLCCINKVEHLPPLTDHNNQGESSLDETSISPDTHPKIEKNNKNLCRLLKVDSLHISVDHDHQSDAKFNVTAFEIEKLAKSIAEETKRVQIRAEELLLKKQIYEIISINDNKFFMEIIYNIALKFSYENLSSDELSSDADYVGKLIMKLVGFFNNSKNNMAFLTGCLVCVFRAIVNRSSIAQEDLQSKFYVFMAIIKKHIKLNDRHFWKEWFLPNMFLDWCSVLVSVFMVENKVAKLDETQIENAKWYFKKIKRGPYVLENTNTEIKSGIFEFSKIEDLSDIGLVDTKSETECNGEDRNEAIKEPFVETPESKVEIKLEKKHESETIIKSVSEPLLVVKSEPEEKENAVDKTVNLCGNSDENTNESSAIKIKQDKKYIRVCSEFHEINSFVNSPTTYFTNLVVPPSVFNQNIENTRQSNSTVESTQAITGLNESSAFFTIPNNPQKYHLTNSVSQTNNNTTQPHPPPTNGLMSTQSSFFNAVQYPTITNTNGPRNVSTNSYSSGTQAPNPYALPAPLPSPPYALPGGPRVPQLNNIAQNYNYNGYYNTSSNGIRQPYLMNNNTFAANNMPKNQSVPVQNTQIACSNVSTLPYGQNLFGNNSCGYTRITSSTNSNETRTPLLSGILSDSTVLSKTTSSNGVSMNPNNVLNHQRSNPMNNTNTVSAATIGGNQFVPVPNTQIIQPNTSTVLYDQFRFNNTSCRYTQNTSSMNINIAQTPFLSNLLPNGKVTSKTVSIYPSNGPNHQNPKSVIVRNSSGKSSSTASTYQPPEPIPQTSPDLPNAQSPNMPHQSNTNKRTFLHQKCTNANCSIYLTITDTFDQYSINCCANGHYCSAVCQNSDRYYHKNECYQSQ